MQRFLEYQPVTARPPGRFYLLGKFIRRNRLAVGAGISLALSLLAGLVVTIFGTYDIVMGECDR